MSVAGRTEGTGVGGAILRYAPSRFVEPLLGFLAIPVLTRALGASAYGDFSVVLLTAGLLRSLGFDWISSCALRFRTPMAGELDRFYSNQLAGLIAATVVTTLLVFGGADLLPERVRATVGALLIWMLIDAVVSAFAFSGEMVLRATHRPVAFTVSRSLQGVARHVIGVGGLLLISRDIPTYFMFRIAALALVALWSWSAIGAWRHLRWGGVSVKVLRQHFLFGAPLAVTLLAASLRMAGNRYVVLTLAGSAATGLFSAAVNIGGAPLLIFEQIVMLGLYPLAIDRWERGDSIRPVVRDGLRWFALIGLPTVAGLSLLARPLLTVIAGPEYADAWPVLALLAVATFFFCISQYFTLRFMVAKGTLKMAAISLTAGVINIGLSILLVPRHGYVAAAAATLVANLLLCAAAMIWGVRPGRDVLPLRAWLKTLAATAAMGAVVGGLQRQLAIDDLPSLLLVVAAGVLTYTLVLWRTGEIDPELAYVRGWRR